MTNGDAIWAAVVQECLAAGKHCVPDAGGGEPWFAFDAIAHLSGLKESTVENNAVGLPRHPAFAMIRLSDYTERAEANAKKKKPTTGKACRKRPQGRK